MKLSNFRSPKPSSYFIDCISSLHDKNGSICDIKQILSHRFDSKHRLKLEIEWTNGNSTYAPFLKVRKDEPLMVAKYILHHDDLKRHSRWARSTIRNMKRAIRRLHCMYNPSSSAHDALSWETWSAMPAYARICCNLTIAQPTTSSTG